MTDESGRRKKGAKQTQQYGSPHQELVTDASAPRESILVDGVSTSQFHQHNEFKMGVALCLKTKYLGDCFYIDPKFTSLFTGLPYFKTGFEEPQRYMQ